MTQEELDKKARFRTVIRLLGNDRLLISKELGYKKKYFDQMLSARKTVSDAVVLKLSKRYKKVNPDWILYGTGEALFENIDEEESRQLNEPKGEYRRSNEEPFEMLRQKMEGFDARIRELEDEMRRLKDGKE